MGAFSTASSSSGSIFGSEMPNGRGLALLLEAEELDLDTLFLGGLPTGLKGGLTGSVATTASLTASLAAAAFNNISRAILAAARASSSSSSSSEASGVSKLTITLRRMSCARSMSPSSSSSSRTGFTLGGGVMLTGSGNNIVEDESVLRNLSLEAQRLWETDGGDKAYAKSFWICKEDTPKCLLEKFALQMGKFHAYHQTGDEDAFIGAEFWVQYREGNYRNPNTEHGLEFHFDKDEVAAKQDEWYHPTYSTVTYLPKATTAAESSASKKSKYPAGGVPLVVFSTESPEEGEAPRRTPQMFPKYSWIVQPQPNQHVMFNGNLLHGCPSDLIPTLLKSIESTTGQVLRDEQLNYSRLALAVNVWTRHEPEGLKRLDCAALFAANKAGTKKQAPIPDIQIDATEVTTFRKVKCDSRMPEDNQYLCEEHKAGDTAPLPIREIAEEFRKSLLSGGSEESSVVAVKYYID